MNILSKIFKASAEFRKRNKFKEFQRFYKGDLEATNIAYAGWLATRGNQRAMRNRLDQAIEEYREAIKFNPKHYSAYISLGMALADKDLCKEAITVLEQVTDELCESYSETAIGIVAPLGLKCNLHYALCKAYLGLNDRQKAFEHGSISLRMNEDVRFETKKLYVKGQLNSRIAQAQNQNLLMIADNVEQLIKKSSST